MIEVDTIVITDSFLKFQFDQ